ncbi:ABC transporter permease [Kineosporia babensis]|uniref:Transport permease protein n=1 Tax=Kineosporia babensis TaxID=499548 RepID=A0A9X1NDE9_9ACTN|nr:ABC transporter permease [Kineosporia babensis]MCD5311211.1 ABC transporter permease [Kineosporia babensis]
MKNNSVVMLRRNLRHTTRNPVAVFNAILFPVILMLMFVYVFGDAFDVGGDYLDYATPGMLLLAVVYGLSATIMAVNSDMTTGIINRFKVMDVSRGAVLNGHVVATILRTSLAILAVLSVALLLGYRPQASALQGLSAAGVLLLVVTAVSWLSVALGLAAKTAETAAFSGVPLVMLPFFSSAIVPADAMGTGVRQFAEYQPFTSIIESLRGFLAGSPDLTQTWVAIAWSAGIILLSLVWSGRKFSQRA